VSAVLAGEVSAALKKRDKGLLIVFTSASLGGTKGIKHGTGRGSIVKGVAKAIGAETLSTGDIFREKARELGLDINAMQKYAAEHPEADVELDDAAVARVKKAVAEGRVVVADSNLLPYFMKDNAVRIAVDTDDRIRAKRVLASQRFGDKALKDEKAALDYLNARSKEELRRYKSHPNARYHAIDLSDQSFFDGTVNNDGTLEGSVEQALRIILKVIA
jgi:cytidylate kinase